MAGRNRYKDLKQFGEKTVKFKQGRYLTGLCRSPDNEETMAALYEKVRYGVCFVVVMEWLATRLKLSGIKFERDNDAHHLTVMPHLATLQAWYEDLERKPGRLRVAAEKFGLNLTSNQRFEAGSHGEDDPVKHAIGLVKSEVIKAKLLMIIHMTNIKAQARCSHAIGIERSIASTYFFDPNVGEYRVPQENIENFFRCYFGLLKQRNENFKISFYLVTHKDS